jgi:hypothetical protein
MLNTDLSFSGKHHSKYRRSKWHILEYFREGVQNIVDNLT